MGYKNIGSTTAQLLKAEQSYDPKQGWKTTLRYRGIASALTSLADSLAYAGASIRIDPESDSHNYFVLSATFGVSEYGSTTPPEDTDLTPLSDNWELEGNDLEKSVWELPTIKDQLAIMHAATGEGINGFQLLTEFRKDVNDLVNGTMEDPGADPNAIIPVGIGLNTALLAQWIKELCMGVESFIVSQWVLRRTREIAPNCRIKPSMTNVMRVFTTAQLGKVNSIPSVIKFDLPSGYWLKKSPRVTGPSDDGNWTITEEWWHSDSYSSLLYSAAT